MKIFFASLLMLMVTLGKVKSEYDVEKTKLKLFDHSLDSNSEKNYISVSEGDEGEKTSSFKQNHFVIVNSDRQLEEVLHSGTLQLLIFLFLGDKKWKNQLISQNFLDFLRNYDEAAANLNRYSIHLGLVNCSSEVSTEYCSPEKSGNFAHGFQKQQEKIGFPIETLFSVDSIIASTLHLSLLYSVPIIQSLAERKVLEDRHRFKKDIILSLHKSLGTREHRLFLEISEKYKNNFVFSITTYSSAIYGLPNIPSLEEVNPLVFILHCSNGQIRHKTSKKTEDAMGSLAKDYEDGYDPCAVVSFFDGAFQNPDFLDFLNRFQNPLWDDINPKILSMDSKVANKFFNDSSLPKVVFIHDLKNENRVLSTVPTIAKLLIGTVNIFTINKENLTKNIQIFLKIDPSDIRTPAVLFLNDKQDTAILNDFDDAVSWIREELESVKMEKRRVDNQEEIRAIHQLFDLEELREDDEVAKEMVSEDNFSLILPLKEEDDLKKIIEMHRTGVLAIAFYLSWDPVSNILLQHLQGTAEGTKEMRGRFLFYRVNCFDWTDLCDSMDIITFPVLQLWNSNGTSITYNGPIEEHQILLTLLLLECTDQPLNLNKSEYEFPFASVKSSPCLAIKEAPSFTTGIFSSKKDARAFVLVAKLLYGYKLTGIFIDKDAVKNKCLEGNSGCVVISKKNDFFQPQFVINEILNDSETLLKLIEYHTENVFGPLHPSNVAVMKFEEDCKPADATFKNILVVLMLASCTSEGITGDLSNHVQTNTKFSLSSISNEFCPNFLNTELKSRFLTEEMKLCTSRNMTRNADMLSEEDRNYFRNVGFVAEQLSSPGLVFSYICSQDELGTDILNTYGLKSGQSHLVAVRKDEGQVYIFESSSRNRNAIRQWLKYVLVGKATPKISLPSEEWTPVLEGFDYLSYMEEDKIREAEEQLAYDMEIDIGAYNSRGSKPYVRKRN